MNTPAELSPLAKEIRRRRTFAIISHPDAGKTTLTEKLLLYGGAIHLAGAVKAKKTQRHTTSDWMELEKQRGISVSTTVLNFEYQGSRINLLDTPGHKDFSEDTYRTLMAADSSVMLIDGAKGVEVQTRKLFEVCRLRNLPIFTFINKMDRPAREPLDLLDELEKVLGIRSCPMTWPIGLGDRFRGVYDRATGEVHLFDTSGQANAREKKQSSIALAPEDPKLYDLLLESGLNEADAEEILEQFRAELELLEVAGDPFDLDRVLAGELTPVFFGSAMNNFGVEHFLKRFIEIAPGPTSRKADMEVEPTSEQFSGLIFKIQANMDPKHRDRVAFFRVCSGKFVRGMSAKHARLKKDIKLTRPLVFFAQEREIVEEAFAGDIVGLVDTTGDLRIGDTLCTGKRFQYERIPLFSPEFFSKILIRDPMKRKQLSKGLSQLSEEGVIQLYQQRGLGDKDPIIGAVGGLQMEVLQHRLLGEYNVEIIIDNLPFVHARWVTGDNFDLKAFQHREDSMIVIDRDDQPVILFRSDWALSYAVEKYPDLTFLTTAPLKQGD